MTKIYIKKYLILLSLSDISQTYNGGGYKKIQEFLVIGHETPWHSQVDFDLACKYDLPMEQIIGWDGKLYIYQKILFLV